MTSRSFASGAVAGLVWLAFATVPACAAEVLVKVDNFVFTPASVTIHPGDTVVWENLDDIPHSIVAKQGAFRSKVIDTEGKYSFTFASAGEFAYFCGLHPHMTGTIVVTP